MVLLNMVVEADGTIDNGNEKSYLGMLYKGEGRIWILVFIMLIW